MVQCSVLLTLPLLSILSLVSTRSSKKGLCVPPGTNFHCGDLAPFTNVSWWYNWKVTANHDLPPEDYCTCSTGSCGPQPADKSFVPMVWNIQLMQEDPVEERYPILLGFNEPNHEDQSNIEPELAAAAWIELQNLYPDKILVSPAPAGGSTSWFDPFFEACEALGCRIDYLATHDYVGNANQVMNRLEKLYQRYGRKVWLTEFAVCCTRDEKVVTDFVKEILPRLEQADFVFRYSWFITRFKENSGQQEVEEQEDDWFLDPVNSLLRRDSAELSEVGILYNSL